MIILIVKNPIKIIKSSRSARPALSKNAIALSRFFRDIWIDGIYVQYQICLSGRSMQQGRRGEAPLCRPEYCFITL